MHIDRIDSYLTSLTDVCQCGHARSEHADVVNRCMHSGVTPATDCACDHFNYSSPADLPAVESVTAQLRLVTPANEPLQVDVDLTDSNLIALLQGMAARERASLQDEQQLNSADSAASHRRERANLLEIAAHYVRRARDIVAPDPQVTT